MRLTLRTLLAWMDRVLPPEPLGELGDKVAASPVATELVDRVEAAVSRDTLPAPPPDARGLVDDANSVAEYLDNVLPADRLEPFERACLDSDVRLAEAAACHRMLAEVVADPGCVPPVEAEHVRRLREIVRERLPGLADAARNSPSGRPRGSSAPEPIPGHEPSKPPPATVDRRRAPVAAWIAAGTAVALLATLGAVLGWSLLTSKHRGRDVAVGGDAEPGRPAVAAPAAAVPVQVAEQRELGDPAAVRLPAGVAGPSRDGTPAEATVPATDATPAAAGPAIPAAAAPAARGEPIPAQPSSPALGIEPAHEAIPSGPRSPPPDDRRVPHGDALAIVAPRAEPAAPPRGEESGGPAPAGDRPDTESAAEAAPAAGPNGLVVTGVALHRPRDDADWRSVVTDEPLDEPVQLLVPPWCSAVAEVPAASIELEPATRAVISREADGSPRVEVIFGRAVIRPAAADVRIGVSAGGLVGAVSGAARQPVGVDVELPRAAGSDPATAGDRRRAVVVAGPAALTWIQSGPDGLPPAPLLAGLPPELPLDAGASIRWDSLDAAAATVTLPAAEPDWLRRPATGGRIEAAAVGVLAARLRSADSAAAALAAMLDDVRAENRMVAAAALSLIGDYDPLVGLLVADPRAGGLREAQWDALETRTVPLALARGAKSAAALLEALARRSPGGERELLAELVRGMSDEALAAGGAERLVAALDDPAVVVRRYAIRTLRDVLGSEAREPVAYRADRDPALQREAVAWWRRMADAGRLRRVPPAAGP